MTREKMLVSQFMAQLLVPNLFWMASVVFFGQLAFPISQTDDATLLFPKLAQEARALEILISPEAASRYVLSYANSFVLGAAVFFMGIAYIFFARFNEDLDTTKFSKFDHKIEKIDAKGDLEKRKPNLVLVGIVLLMLCYYAFFLTLTYTPAPGTTPEKQLKSIYAAFSISFPLIFYLSYLLILTTISKRRVGANPPLRRKPDRTD